MPLKRTLLAWLALLGGATTVNVASAAIAGPCKLDCLAQKHACMTPLRENLDLDRSACYYLHGRERRKCRRLARKLFMNERRVCRRVARQCRRCCPRDSSSCVSTTTSTTSTFPPSTTSTSTTTSSSTIISSPCFVDRGLTVLDTCTGLEWEKKTAAPGLHDVKTIYAWAGCCSACCDPVCDASPFCQPNELAAAACAAHADGGTYGCSTCETGTCTMYRGVSTTIWDWVSQLNLEQFAGYDDWRIPSNGGYNFPATGTSELESILLMPFVCLLGYDQNCVDPLFEPTKYPNGFYWSASTLNTIEGEAPDLALVVGMDFGRVAVSFKKNAAYARAVRTARTPEALPLPATAETN